MASVKKIAKKGSIEKMKNEKNILLAIPLSISGIILTISVFFLLFAQSNLSYLIPIVWGLVVIAIVACFFAYKSKKKK